ncbi:uncharacterized protein B0I36DRAFT_341557 [Microdochium trichocladiopsis]|uniref:Uncharacterized protein n=1 Tax=Microdochium trichocladiopsis TaxID=1682393 RepID=A0A9P9BHJ9_9PEZI|nr:uncharacterized protein B0I36DRAFT_341557 [Microdochium trichocladiopsis]KAH7010910.1 hypothetical protein B0I36DRAFT_341557 [Microdochium trichocladiopsis]
MRLSSSTILVLPLPLLGCLAFPAGSGQNLLESERRESLSRVDRPPFVATRAISPSIANNYLPVIKRGEEVPHLEGRPVVKRGEEVAHVGGGPIDKRSPSIWHVH